jgi:hypothetical protein
MTFDVSVNPGRSEARHGVLDSLRHSLEYAKIAREYHGKISIELGQVEGFCAL